MGGDGFSIATACTATSGAIISRSLLRIRRVSTRPLTGSAGVLHDEVARKPADPGLRALRLLPRSHGAESPRISGVRRTGSVYRRSEAVGGMDRSPDGIRQARRDLEKIGADTAAGYYEGACFTTPQAAEKALMALYQRLHGSGR